MKTVSRLIWRQILSTFGIVLMVFIVNAALFFGIIAHFENRQRENVRISEFAAAFERAPDGMILPDGSLDWRRQYSWAMLLNDAGNILWSEALPPQMNRAYTVPEAAAFSRWYFDDYPVMVYRNDFGLLVAGLPRGSMTRLNYYIASDVFDALLKASALLLVLDVALMLLVCLLLGYRASRPLREAGNAIDRLAEGEAVRLRETGAMAELAQKLNRAGERLRRQGELIARRDTARTNWIAGVSHDIRTPLSLIMGYAEQLERTSPPDSDERRRGAAIRAQSQKIKTLIEDLNLTSKLQYDAQPLHLSRVQIGPMLRQCAAAFCDALDDRFSFDFTVTQDAERAAASLDIALMTRALDNLLNNSVRHNPDGCAVSLRGDCAEGRIRITVRDNGAGYPLPVLNALRDGDAADAPHILGLHLARQVAEAHGGSIRFENDGGAVSVIELNADPH